MRKAVFVWCWIVLTACAMHAQEFRGTILGTVSDSSGAVVPGAKVKVRIHETE